MFKIYLCNIKIVVEEWCEGLPEDKVEWRTLTINDDEHSCYKKRMGDSKRAIGAAP
jgi:hypothetical protein